MCLQLLWGCNNLKNGLYGNRPPHETYKSKLLNAGFESTYLGQHWLAADTQSLQHPLTIKLPYTERGYFAADKPFATGFSFNAKAGDVIYVNLNKKPAGNTKIFGELWQRQEDGQLKWLKAHDTLTALLSYEVTKDNHFVFRIQPELLVSVEYTLEIYTGPSLAFPVPEGSHPLAGSFWGDSRDNGGRRHEGVDIFGSFKTPVVAAAQGTITNVAVNRLGGKVIFLRPDNKNYQLYYAHLDSQIVRTGDVVMKGDTLGLIGNTGNARNTPTHLHFGIYGPQGALDPYPFINLKRGSLPVIPATSENLGSLCRTRRSARRLTDINEPNEGALMAQGTVAYVTAVGESFTRALLPDGLQGFINNKLIVAPAKPLKQIALTAPVNLFDRPDTTAATISTFAQRTIVNLLGNFNDYQLVQEGDKIGWIFPKR